MILTWIVSPQLSDSYGLEWPDPSSQGTYRLEIISASFETRMGGTSLAGQTLFLGIARAKGAQKKGLEN